MKWEIVENAYYKVSRLVEDGTGRILGVVRGTSYDPRVEWSGFVEGRNPPHIGRYTTEALAQRAVEAAIEEGARGE